MKIFENIALELIDYQNNDPFVSKLESTLESIYKEMDNKIYMDNKTLVEKSTYIKDIEELIKSRFNMNVTFEKSLHVISPAAIIPFFGDYLREAKEINRFGSDLVSKMFNFQDVVNRINVITKERKKILDSLHNKKGYIDLKNARVGGYLSELKHFIIIDFFFLKNNFDISPRELTAIILHELGHAFTGLEYHHKLETTNSTIADILDNLNNNKPDKAMYIFKKNFTKKEFQDIAVNTKEEIHDFYGKLALAYLEELKTQMINSKYDETNFENLADSFASRFNLYKDLVSGLNKLNSKAGVTMENTVTSYAILYFIQILMFGLMLVFITPIGAIIFALLFITMYKSNASILVYDKPVDRYNRIKNSLINNLKNINMSEDLIKDLLDQYIFIDEIIQKTGYFEGVYKHIADLVFTSNRNSNYYIKLQQQIENGLNNMLFVSAAKVKVA
jgi:hypothetical protein